MADTDLLFKIIAQDEYKAQLESAIGMVDKLSGAERNALKSTTDKVEADQKAASAIMEKIGATQKGTESTDQLSHAEQDAAQSTDKQATAEKGLSDQTDKVGESNRGVIGSFTELKSAIELGQQTIEAFKKVWDFAKEGAAINRIGEQFNAVAAEAGIAGDKLVEAMDKAARGTVDDEELMQVATRSLTQGVITSQDQLVRFTEIARASAVRFGGDTSSALQSILYATEVGAQRQLKATLGVVDFSKAYDDLALKLGKRKQDLTDEEQLQARVNAVLDKGAELVRKVGAAGDDTLTSMQRLETRFKEFGDVVKSNVATTVEGLFFGQEKLNALFIGHEDEVRKTSKTYEDYSAELIRSGAITGQLVAVTQEQRDSNGNLIGTYIRLNDQLYGVANGVQVLTKAQYEAIRTNDNLDAGVRAVSRSEQAAAESAKQLAMAQNFAMTGAYGLSGALDETNRAVQRVSENRAYGTMLADSTTLAIQYTQAEQKRGDLEQQLSDLNAKIDAQGTAHSVVVNNQRMTEEQRALALQKLSVAQEDVLQVQRKSGETDAEYGLRLEQAKGKVNDLSQALGTHTAVVGGATKAQLDQKKALEEQITAFDKAAEHTRALDVFNAVTKSFQDGKIGADEYRDRIGALNQISHLYTDTALREATQQELLIKSFASADTSDWRKQLSDNATALDGVVQKTTETADAVSKTIMTPRLNTKNVLEDAETAKEVVTQKLGETSEAATRIPIRPRADTQQAETQIDQLTRKQKNLEGLPPATLKVSADTKQVDTALAHVTDQFSGKKFEATATMRADTQAVDTALAHLHDNFEGRKFEATATTRADIRSVDAALSHLQIDFEGRKFEAEAKVRADVQPVDAALALVQNQFEGKKFEATATTRADTKQVDAALAHLHEDFEGRHFEATAITRADTKQVDTALANVKDQFDGKKFEATAIAQADTQAVDTALSHIRDNFEGKKFEAEAITRADTQGVDQALIHVKDQFDGKKFEATATIRADVQQADTALTNIKDKFEGKKLETTATARADVTQASRDIEEWRSKNAAKSLIIPTAFDTKAAQESIADLSDKQTAATQAIATESNRGMQAVETQVTRTNSNVKTSGELAMKTTRDVVGDVSNSIKTAANLAGQVILDLKQMIDKIEGEHIIKFTIKVGGDSIPTIPSGGSASSRQHGGPIQSEGFYWLHPNEYVLSAAMRAGQQPIPTQVLPTMPRGNGGSTVINNNNFYDAQAAKLWQEKQRMDSLQSVLEAM